MAIQLLELEASYYGIPAINVGSRQQMREELQTFMIPRYNQILKSINKIKQKKKFRKFMEMVKVIKILKILNQIVWKKIYKKYFLNWIFNYEKFRFAKKSFIL